MLMCACLAVCILLDVGTMPGHKSIYQLWKVFDRSSNVGGACGEIAAYKAKGWTKLLNPVRRPSNATSPPAVMLTWPPDLAL